MTLETLLLYGGTAVIGWLARHHGWFAHFAPPSPLPTPIGGVPVPGTGAPSLKSEIDALVKDAVAAAVQAVIADLRGAAQPAAAK